MMPKQSRCGTIAAHPPFDQAWQQLKWALPQDVMVDWSHFIEVYGRFMVNSFTLFSSEVTYCSCPAPSHYAAW